MEGDRGAPESTRSAGDAHAEGAVVAAYAGAFIERLDGQPHGAPDELRPPTQIGDAAPDLGGAALSSRLVTLRAAIATGTAELSVSDVALVTGRAVEEVMGAAQGLPPDDTGRYVGEVLDRLLGSLGIDYQALRVRAAGARRSRQKGLSKGVEARPEPGINIGPARPQTNASENRIEPEPAPDRLTIAGIAAALHVEPGDVRRLFDYLDIRPTPAGYGPEALAAAAEYLSPEATEA